MRFQEDETVCKVGSEDAAVKEAALFFCFVLFCYLGISWVFITEQSEFPEYMQVASEWPQNYGVISAVYMELKLQFLNIPYFKQIAGI